jgi:hypothetical protein
MFGGARFGGREFAQHLATMKADTAIVVCVAVFVFGAVFGYVLNAQNLDWNWGDVPGWINAGASVVLAGAIFFGYRFWTKQFLAQRDHDLAMRLLATIDKGREVVDEFRTPGGMLSDMDVPVAPSPYLNEPEHEREYRKYIARYRARQLHLVAAASARQSAAQEAVNVWGALGEEIGSLVHVLAEQEAMFVTEAFKWVESFRLNDAVSRKEVNMAFLFAPADKTADIGVMIYRKGMEKMKELLKPKIRME